MQELLKGLVEGVALAGDGANAADDLCPRTEGGGFGAVGAVVGHHIDIPQLRRIVLGKDALHQSADDSLLIPGGDDHRKTGLGLRPPGPDPFFQHEERHNGKIDGKDLQSQGKAEKNHVQLLHSVCPPFRRFGLLGSVFILSEKF